MRITETKLNALILSRRVLNHLGLRSNKVFAIGFNKCGTTSLDALFRSLGRPANHGVRWRECNNSLLLRSFDCFSDGIPRDLAKLDSMFPGSKFILQVRDLESWVYSRLAHIDRKKNVGSYQTNAAWDTTAEAVQQWIRQRNEYHLFVLRYFAQRPNDLLIVNFIRDEDAATKICRFLGHDIQVDRPRRNANPRSESPSRYRAILAAALEQSGVPFEEAANDLYCPSLAHDAVPIHSRYDTSLVESA